MRRVIRCACGTDDDLVILEGRHGGAIGEVYNIYTELRRVRELPAQPTTAMDFATAALAGARARVV